jgi:MGT family glycosyltransferase
MSNVLFLSVPSHGHVNPTIGLVDELVRRGERITYFASAPFQERIERAGAEFRAYALDLDMFKGMPPPGAPSPMLRIVASARAVIADILAQTAGESFDYLVHSTPFLFAKPMARLLKLPTVSSLAVFAGLEAFFQHGAKPAHAMFATNPQVTATLAQAGAEVEQAFGVTLPGSLPELLFNPGEVNLVYTSRYFAGDLPYFDDSYKFVGPPVHDRRETTDFPLERLAGRRVLYISLGTVFGDRALHLYETFFQAFAHWDGVVVLAAYGVDLSQRVAPANFIVRHYVPQGEILKHACAAITHGGMNSMSDLLAAKVPFVCLPLGADQPALASRAQALGATISLDLDALSAQALRGAVDRVMAEPGYRAAIARIAESFAQAGGYPKAVDEIFTLKRERGIA